ncbi:MAG: hypothetical protein WAN35_12200 [Terracidiphilus sp.]
MVEAFDQAVRVVGAPGFEMGMEQARFLCGLATHWAIFVNDFIQTIRTVEDLRVALDSRMSLSEKEQAYLLFALQNLPQMLRLGISAIAKKAASTLPPPTGGRKPALTAAQAQDALDYVSQLNRKGTPMAAAKQRASQKFGCSLRTIARLWANRESIPEEESPTIQDILAMLFQQGQADGWQTPRI